MIDIDYLFDDKKEDFQGILSEIRDGKAQLVDIREPSEWQGGRFKCAVNIPLSGLAQGEGVAELKEIRRLGKKIYLHCRSGSRARMAEQILAEYECSEFTVIPFSMMEMLEQGFQLAEE